MYIYISTNKLQVTLEKIKRCAVKIRDVARTLLLEGVRLNLPEFTNVLGPGQTTRFFTRFFTRQKIEEKIEPFGHLVE